MSRAKQLVKMLDENKEQGLLPFSFPTPPEKVELPFTAESIKQRLEARIAYLGFEGIQVDEVEVDNEGHIIVTLVDLEDNEMTIIFMHTNEEGSHVLIGDESDLDSDEQIIIDLDPVQPSLMDTPFGPYIGFAAIDWLNKSTMETILTAGDLLDKSEDPTRVVSKDAFGNRIIVPVEGLEQGEELEAIVESIKEGEEPICELYKTVVRGGKKIRIPVVRRTRKKRLTPRQLQT